MRTALQGSIPVEFGRVFPMGAFVAGSFDPVRDFDASTADRFVQAAQGANLRELMERMGHSTTRAALIYLHSSSDRQHAIAAAVDKLAKAALRQAKDPSRPRANLARKWHAASAGRPGKNPS
jgi:hypothetical protein